MRLHDLDLREEGRRLLRESLHQELASAGFPQEEIERAFKLVRDLIVFTGTPTISLISS